MANMFENSQITSYGDRMQIFGLGSDWDTKTILEAELNILKLRQQPHVTKKSEYESEKQTWGALQTSLSNFNNIVKSLKDITTDAKSVSLSDEGFMSVSASSSAMDASYSISVQSIATNQRLMGDQIAMGPMKINETVQLNGKDLVLTEDMDIKGMAKAINEGSYGVDAVVLDNRLVLTAKKSGPSNEIKFSDSAAWETIGITNNGVVKNELTEAKGAAFTINGIPMTSENNTFTEIEGLTINLTKKTEEDININVNRSADQMVTKLKEMVKAYNTVIGNINSLSGEKGVLQGEGIPRNLKRQMNNLLFSVTDSSNTMMYQMGISLHKDAKNGTISLDETKVREMYNEDPLKVEKMLTGENGFSGKLYAVVDEYSKSTGMIQTEIDGLNSRIKRIDETLDKYDTQFERQKESLILKYAQFETMMSSMTLQNDYIQAQLGSWSGKSDS